MTFTVMRNKGCRSGATLTDLITTLSIVAILLAVATPVVVRARNAHAVRSARDAAAGTVERARSLALARGMARVTIDTGAGEFLVEAPPGSPVGAPLRIASTFSVAVSVDGAAARVVTFDYNAIGIGVMASRTVRFRRGASEAGLSLSTYGRVRRW